MGVIHVGAVLAQGKFVNIGFARLDMGRLFLRLWPQRFVQAHITSDVTCGSKSSPSILALATRNRLHIGTHTAVGSKVYKELQK